MLSYQSTSQMQGTKFKTSEKKRSSSINTSAWTTQSTVWLEVLKGA